MLHITWKTIKEVSKIAFNLSMANPDKPKDDELFLENFAVVEIEDVSEEMEIWFFYKDGALGYNFDLDPYFPWLNKDIIALEVEHWTKQFITSWSTINNIINV